MIAMTNARIVAAQPARIVILPSRRDGLTGAVTIAFRELSYIK
jgi:hypothetical protein